MDDRASGRSAWRPENTRPDGAFAIAPAGSGCGPNRASRSRSQSARRRAPWRGPRPSSKLTPGSRAQRRIGCPPPLDFSVLGPDRRV